MRSLVRHELNKKIKLMSSYPVSFISSPGGVGKTTSVNLFLSNLTAHIAYFSLYGDFDENWAFSKVTKILSLSLGVEIGGKLPTTRSDVDNLIHEIESKAKFPVYIVLDDVNLKKIPLLLKLIQVYSYTPSKNIHFIIITREFIHNFTYSLCSSNYYTMTYSDFALSINEIATICKLENISLSTSDIQFLFDLSNGWFSAVQLVIESYKKTGQLYNNGSLSSLLRTLIYDSVDPDIQLGLIKLSILNEFTFDHGLVICGNKDVMDYIVTLERENHFVQLNHSFYCIAPLFKEFLFKELQLSSVDINSLHSVCGEWYLANTKPLDALLCFIKCNHFDRIIEILNDYSEFSFVDLSPQIMSQVYSSLPDSYKNENPHIYFRWVLDCITNLPQLDGIAMLDDLKNRIDTHQILGDMNYLLAEYHYIHAFTHFNDINAMFKEFIISYNYFNNGASKAVTPSMIATFGSYQILFLYFNTSGQLKNTVYEIVENAKYFCHISRGINEGGDYQVQAEYSYDTGNYPAVLYYAIPAYNRALQFEQISIAAASLFLQCKLALMQFDYESYLFIKNKLLELQSLNIVPVVHSQIECALAHLYILDNQIDKVPTWLQEGNFSHSKILHEGIFVAPVVHGIYLVRTKNYKALHRLTSYIEVTNHNQMFMYAHLYTLLFKSILSINSTEFSYDSGYFNELLDLCRADQMTSLIVELSFALEMIIDLHITRNPYEENLISLCNKNNKMLHQKNNINTINATLTSKEIVVLAEIAKNKTVKDIASDLCISTNTVQTHLKSIYRKLDIGTKVEAIRYFEAHFK